MFAPCGARSSRHIQRQVALFDSRACRFDRIRQPLLFIFYNYAQFTEMHNLRSVPCGRGCAGSYFGDDGYIIQLSPHAERLIG